MLHRLNMRKRITAFLLALILLLSLSTVSSAESVAAVVSVDGARVYAQPSASAANLALVKGTQLNVVAVNGSWACVEKNGVYAYCYLAVLSRAEEEQTQTYDLKQAVAATVTSDGAKVYASPDLDAKSLDVQKGLQVNVVAVSGEWAYVECSGNYAYCMKSILTADSELATSTPTPTPTPSPTPTPDASNAIPATVTSGGARVYLSASTSAKSYSLAKGTQLNVLAINGDWAYVEKNGIYAYCLKSVLTANSELTTATPTPTPTATPTSTPDTSNAIPATVTSSGAKVYVSASTSAKSYSLAKGTQVNVLAINGDWAYVEKNGIYAYCLKSALTANSALNTPTPTVTATATPSVENAIPATVTSTGARVYVNANPLSTNYAMAKGLKVNVLSISGDWAYVECNGAYGYCYVSVLTKDTDNSNSYTKETFEATVITSDAKAYSSASTASNSVSVAMGTNVTVTAYNIQWACVTYNGASAFMPIKNLSRASMPTLTEGSSGDVVYQVQVALLKLGYQDAIPTTSYTSYTASVVKLFQQACGMTASGVATPATLRVLAGGYAPQCSVLDNTYKSGSTGENVRRIQLRLYALGYLSKSSSVDSDYGATTTAAVKLFQSSNGMTVSGTLDSTTLARLYSESAVALPSNGTAADAVSGIGVTAGNQQNNSPTISSTLASTTSSYSSSMSSAQKLEYVIYVAQNQLGKPYVYATSGTSSYDCTGLTCYCFKQIGISLKRSAQNQGYDNTYPKVSSASELQRGDLVYFNTVSDSDLSDHAGIYLGAGYFIHASSGQGKVVVSTLTSGYYSRVFSWGRRVFS